MTLASSPPAATSDNGLPADLACTIYIEALTALRDGHADHAADLLIAALRRQPAHLGMRRNLVRALLAAGRYQQALLQADVCIGARPDEGEFHFARGTALNALNEPSKACAALTRAIALTPNHAPSWLNLANAWTDLDDLTAAERLCRTAIGLDAGLAEAHASLGYVLLMQGDTATAIESCEAAIGRDPECSQAHWNLALARLLGGDLRRGFKTFEWRKRHGPYRGDFPTLPGAEWNGADPDGKTILVRAEQGAGDVIQFARYLLMIRRAGGHPVLACAQSLLRLIGSMPGVTAVRSGDPLPRYDAWVDQMSLPRIFETTLDTIPDSDGYLQADAGRVAAWRASLPAGLKVGVAFAGNPRHPNDRRRSITAEVAKSLLDVPGVNFINLQHGAMASRLGLADLSQRLTDYAETAALIANLDLVISVDTSVAHLAGALGKPTWILLPAAPDWRWLLGRTDSPWYGSVRLVRQEHAGDWRGVVRRVKGDLAGLWSRNRPTVPAP